MRIEYKFNKSSEARDCVVESVELILINYKNITQEDFEQELNIDCSLREFLDCVFDYDKIDPDNFPELNDYVINEICEETINVHYQGHYHVVERDLVFSNSNQSYVINNKETKYYGFKDNKNETTVLKGLKETKTFTSQQQLKDYINTIQETIKFIAKSDIDQVIMKEWLGEWEYTNVCRFINNDACHYEETKRAYICDKCCEARDRDCSFKTGSPKLNPNWTFKIN